MNFHLKYRTKSRKNKQTHRYRIELIILFFPIILLTLFPADNLHATNQDINILEKIKTFIINSVQMKKTIGKYDISPPVETQFNIYIDKDTPKKGLITLSKEDTNQILNNKYFIDCENAYLSEQKKERVANEIRHKPNSTLIFDINSEKDLKRAHNIASKKSLISIKDKNGLNQWEKQITEIITRNKNLGKILNGYEKVPEDHAPPNSPKTLEENEEFTHIEPPLNRDNKKINSNRLIDILNGCRNEKFEKAVADFFKTPKPNHADYCREKYQKPKDDNPF